MLDCGSEIDEIQALAEQVAVALARCLVLQAAVAALNEDTVKHTNRGELRLKWISGCKWITCANHGDLGRFFSKAPEVNCGAERNGEHILHQHALALEFWGHGDCLCFLGKWCCRKTPGRLLCHASNQVCQPSTEINSSLNPPLDFAFSMLPFRSAPGDVQIAQISKSVVLIVAQSSLLAW